MKKGCVVSLLVVLGLGFLSCGGCFVWIVLSANSFYALVLEMAIFTHKQQNPGVVVEPTIEAWSEVLKSNPQLQGLPKTADGLLADTNGVPFKIVEEADGYVLAFSAGRDGKMDTDDDQDSGWLGRKMRSQARQQ